MWKNMIFWLWEVQKGTSNLHREMERPSTQFAWGEEKLARTDAPQCVRSEEYLRWPKYIIIPRSGVMETQLEVLVTQENIIIHNDLIHMDSNFNYTANPCENIPNRCSWP